MPLNAILETMALSLAEVSTPDGAAPGGCLSHYERATLRRADLKCRLLADFVAEVC
jgi:hypothetical protein